MTGSFPIRRLATDHPGGTAHAGTTPELYAGWQVSCSLCRTVHDVIAQGTDLGIFAESCCEVLQRLLAGLLHLCYNLLWHVCTYQTWGKHTGQGMGLQLFYSRRTSCQRNHTMHPALQATHALETCLQLLSSCSTLSVIAIGLTTRNANCRQAGATAEAAISLHGCLQLIAHHVGRILPALPLCAAQHSQPILCPASASRTRTRMPVESILWPALLLG